MCGLLCYLLEMPTSVDREKAIYFLCFLSSAASVRSVGSKFPVSCLLMNTTFL